MCAETSNGRFDCFRFVRFIAPVYSCSDGQPANQQSKKIRNLHKLAYLGNVFLLLLWLTFIVAMTVLRFFGVFVCAANNRSFGLGRATISSRNTWDDGLLNCINNDFIRKWKRFISLQFRWPMDGVVFFPFSCCGHAGGRIRPSNTQQLICWYKHKRRFCVFLCAFYHSHAVGPLGRLGSNGQNLKIQNPTDSKHEMRTSVQRKRSWNDEVMDFPISGLQRNFSGRSTYQKSFPFSHKHISN